MFKKAKRANIRRRNESDEDEPDETRQTPLASTLFGPVVDEIPFIETSGNSVTGLAGAAENHHSNGIHAFNVRAVKKDKKVKEAAPVPGPTKASLLSFDDDEGNFPHCAKVASWFPKTCCACCFSTKANKSALCVQDKRILKGYYSCNRNSQLLFLHVWSESDFSLASVYAEGSEVFRVKKSNHSKKIVKQLKREYKEDQEKSGSVRQDIKSGVSAVHRILNTASLLLDALGCY